MFDLTGLTPHGFCLAWQPGLIWLQAGSDLLIAFAYYSIPLALAQFARRRGDLAFRPVFWLFAAFILACGTTHVLGVITLWKPLYWLDGGVKAVTAVLSLVTAAMLWPLLPRALALPSPERLRRLNIELAEQVRERDAAARGLGESEARLRQLYARTPAPLHATDAEGRILEVSDRWLDLLGYDRHAVIGRPIADFYAAEDSAEQRRLLMAFQAGAPPSLAQRRMRTRAGGYRDVEISFDLERDEQGGLQRVLAAVTDVTSRTQAEAALRASEDRLRQAQKMEAVGQLTGGIAHDFNNLLTVILGSLELLGRDETLHPPARRLLGNAAEGAARAARLTSQLLSFSRRQRLMPQPLDPAEVIAGIGELLARTLTERVAFTVRPPLARQWPCLADRNQLESTLVNLVLNARDAIEQGGWVTISFSNLTLDTAGAEGFGPETVPPGDYVSIRVEDTGTGMDAMVQARAFEPFFTTKEVGAGSGLGLAQAWGFVRQSGGTARIESAPGRGTVVELLLPRAMQGLAQTVLPMPSPASLEIRGRGEHVLLVEDDAALRETMAEALASYGYTVSTAPDGAAALAALQGATRIDLLFTDVVMPGELNGIDLARAARQQHPQLPVLFSTGYSHEGVWRHWDARLEVLAKPYLAETLAARIATLLAGVEPETAEAPQGA